MGTLLADGSGDGRISHIRAHQQDSIGLGELLRHARERRGLTLSQLSNETKIPQRHLEALEHDNLAVAGGEFYRRAEIRAYARAVHLDQDLALAQLERALQVAPEAVPETRKTEKLSLSRKRVLILFSVVVAAAVFGRLMGGRDPALDSAGHVPVGTDSPQQRVPSGRQTPTDPVVGPSQPTLIDQVAPRPAPSDVPPPVATEPTGSRAPAVSNVTVTAEQAGAGASAEKVTELVVTTQPAGARVTVDGIGWGITPVTIRYLPPGDKRIRVSKEGYATEEQLVRLVEGHPRTLDIGLRSAP